MPFKNKKSRRAYLKKYYLDHKEQNKERDRKYSLKHSDEITARAAKYNKEHPEQRRKTTKKYRLSHAKQIKEQAKEYRTRMVKYIKEYSKKKRLSLTSRYSILRSTAKRRNLDCLISLPEYEKVTSQPCHYCKGSLSPTGYSLDRINSDIGYVITNVRPCCAICNVAKSDLTELEFREWVIKVYSWACSQEKCNER